MASATIRRIFEASRPLHSRCHIQDPAKFMLASRSPKSQNHVQVRSLSSIRTNCYTPQSKRFTLRRSKPKTSHSSPLTQRTEPFSTSARTCATIIRHNPRIDDDGNEMSITISERAAKRLRQIVSSPPKKNSLTSNSNANASPDSHLRVTVTSGGCHGFQYMMSLEGLDKLDSDEDTVFEFDEGGKTNNTNGREVKAEVVMDQASLELLKGSTVDFTTELIGSQFKIVGNPRATSSCGCGTSFDIE